MAKGQTNQPLSIAIPDAWIDRPEFAALAAKGHRLYALTAMENIDLILSPQAKCFDALVDGDYLDDAVKSARKRKKETKK
jgi:hypothetical protein